MLTYCHHWDVGRETPPATELTERLGQMSHNHALLVLCKTSFPPEWAQAHFYELVDGPSRFLRIYFNSPAAPEALASLRAESRSWLRNFLELRSLALAEQPWQQQAELLSKRIVTQLDFEERELYPALEDFLRLNRPTLEMRYEHQGIRRFLPRLKEALDNARDNRGWERFSLDLIHLIEHHIEHEERGLYPVYERLHIGRKAPPPSTIG